MRILTLGLAACLAALPISTHASEAGDLLRDSLYAGKFEAGLAKLAQFPADDTEAQFGQGVLTLSLGLEGLVQDLYRYGATAPDTSFAAMFFGGGGPAAEPANPDPEKLTYAAFRTVLSRFVQKMDAAKVLLEAGGASGDYVTTIDPLLIRIDLDGDGKAEESESLGNYLAPLMNFNADMPPQIDEPPPSGKIKNKHKLDSTVGLDRADALWLAGYSQVLAVQADFLLAHDFEPLVNTYFHRIFPKAGLPMQGFDHAGSLFVDPTSDSGIADVIAALHNLNFKVIEPERMAGVLARLKSITALSRQNWQAILAETDDNRELVPSPKQTSLAPETRVTDETVTAWMATLDTADQVLDGKLLIPHWRFKQGFDLKAYFETATETDLVMLFTGYGALPFLRDGAIANAQSFAAANAVFGDNLWAYAFWFN
ncbi:hypothetical protein [Devosia sp.]|uniref:hypothetical protein n=1 Tax=Devosia sp. TaxID=1871048 RepID=UPI00326388B4